MSRALRCAAQVLSSLFVSDLGFDSPVVITILAVNAVAIVIASRYHIQAQRSAEFLSCDGADRYQ